jgi:large subunit ribosomal protein L1
MKHGKQYRAARAQIDREQTYSPVEAIRMLKSFDGKKFDETVEVHFRLGLNVRHADEQLRGTLMLPHGTGKEARVAVFAEGDKAREAQEAGADVIGSADLAKRVEEGFTDFDVAIATPDQMGNVGKLGRILGPRGLMPNPKTGTVTMDVGKAVRDAKAGKLEYRTDRGANVHVDRQEELRRAPAGRELRGARGRDRPCEAGGCQGPVHPADHAREYDGPRDPLGSGQDEGHRRGVGGDAAGRRSNRVITPVARDRKRTRSVLSAQADQGRGSGGTERFTQLPAERQKPSRGGSENRGLSLLSASPPVCGLESFEGGEPVKKEDKERVVAELTEQLRTTDTLIVADYRGLTMTQIDELRSKLLENGARFAVVKNTLTRRAAEAAGADALLALLEGPTAIAFLESNGDPVAVAKALSDAARTTRVLEVRGGIFEGRPIEPDEVESLAKLPPMDVLRGQVLGAVTAPLMTIVGLFAAPLQDLYGLLDARIEQLREQGDTSEAGAPEPAPTEESGSEPQAEATAEEATAETAAEPAAEPAAEAEPAPADEPSGSEPQSESGPDETAPQETTEPETQTEEEDQ